MRLYAPSLTVTVIADGRSKLFDGRWSGGGRKLHIGIDATLTRDAQPSPATIYLYNLNDDSLTLLAQKDAVIEVRAGYDNEPLVLLFAGNITRVNSVNNAGDVETTIEAGDGATPHNQAYFSETFSAGVPIKTAIEEIAKVFKQPLQIDYDGGAAFISGTTFEGAAHEMLSKIAKDAGLEWSSVDNRIEVRKQNAPPRGAETAFLIAQHTGLIGLPQRTEEGVSCAVLFIPNLKPARLVELDTRTIQGVYRVESVSISGSNADNLEMELDLLPRET